MTYVIHNDNVSLGDCICSFPGTLHLARVHQQSGKKVALAWTNEAAAEIFPHEKYGIGRANKAKADIRVSLHDMVHKGIAYASMHEHPTAQFTAHVGFSQLSAAPIQPEIAFGEYDVELTDVLISPYILAERERLWPLDRWQVVIDHLIAKGLSVGVLRGTVLPPHEDLAKINPYAQAHFYENAALMQPSLTGVEYITDRPLGEVAYRMSRAKLVITVDSGPARLAHGVNVGKRHILLCNTQVSYAWGTYEEATVLYRDLRTLQPEDVIPLIDAQLAAA
jgi:ADP-heptose:LPS heptosyltransferase